MVDNLASQKVLERAGFERTATLPAFRACGGALRDFFRYERRFTPT
jgi:RimJ/RimL family protein N-acetyltransferase